MNVIFKIDYYIRSVLFVTVSLTISFIWANSVMTPSESAEISDSFSKIIQNILPQGDFLDFIFKYIRKIAHFTEYGILGIQVAIYIFLRGCERKPSFICASIVFGICIALADEGIQYFAGRGNSLLDVLIDECGFLFCMSLTLLFFEVAKYIYNKKTKVR